MLPCFVGFLSLPSQSLHTILAPTEPPANAVRANASFVQLKNASGLAVLLPDWVEIDAKVDLVSDEGSEYGSGSGEFGPGSDSELFQPPSPSPLPSPEPPAIFRPDWNPDWPDLPSSGQNGNVLAEGWRAAGWANDDVTNHGAGDPMAFQAASVTDILQDDGVSY